jgi:hypothetical protein
MATGCRSPTCPSKWRFCPVIVLTLPIVGHWPPLVAAAAPCASPLILMHGQAEEDPFHFTFPRHRRSAHDGDLWGLNPDLSVDMKDNSIREESRRSQPDYNRPGTLCLSDRYTNSHGWCDLVEHDNLAMRAPVLQAIEKLARTSRIRTELRDEYELS